jgi:hypothetical protein
MPTFIHLTNDKSETFARKEVLTINSPWISLMVMESIERLRRAV